MIAEGLETEREAIVALELGADLLQGYLLGRPKPRANVLRDGSAHAQLGIHSLAQAFKTYMVQKINRRKLQHRRYNILLNEILCHLANAEVEQFDALLQVALASYPTAECVCVLDNSGIQITDTVWNPTLYRREAGTIFKPAPKGTDHSLKEYYYILLDVELQKYTTTRTCPSPAATSAAPSAPTSATAVTTRCTCSALMCWRRIDTRRFAGSAGSGVR